MSGTIPGSPGLAVELQQQPFPFAAPFAAVPATVAMTDAQGAYRFSVPALQRMRYGVSAAGFKLPHRGNTAQVWVEASLDVSVKRVRHHRFVVSGRYRPDVPSAATLYRVGHSRSGIAATPVSAGGNSRTFRFPAHKLKPGRYEVRLAMAPGVGIQSTHSEVIKIPRR